VSWFNTFYKGLGTRDIYYSFGWAVSPIECNLAIIASSIPALWPLFRKAFPKLLSELNYSYHADTQRASSKRASIFRSNRPCPMGRSQPNDDDSDDAYMMESINPSGQSNCRVVTPTGSQDGIIDSKDGIVRTTDVTVGYEDATESDRKRDEYGRRSKGAYIG
jgi:hypothetical protein